MGEHATWFDNHFNFFNAQQDRDKLYEAWKVVELELCRDHCSQNLAFNASDHDAAFSRAKLDHKLCLEFQALVVSSQGPRFPSQTVVGVVTTLRTLPGFCLALSPTHSPFHQAVGGPPSPALTASSVQRRVTLFSCTRTPLPQSSSSMGSQPGQNV